MKPITPEQARKNLEIPDSAVKVINNVIVTHFTGTESIFTKIYLRNALYDAGFDNTTIDSIFVRMINLYSNSGWRIDEREHGFIFTELLN